MEETRYSNVNDMSLNNLLLEKRKESIYSNSSNRFRTNSIAKSRKSRKNSEFIIFSEELNEFFLEDSFYEEIMELECQLKYYFSVEKLKKLLDLYKTAIEFYELTNEHEQVIDYQLRMQYKLSEPYVMKKMNENYKIEKNEKIHEMRRSNTMHKSSLIERKAINKEENINRLKMRIKNVKIDSDIVNKEANELQQTSSTNDVVSMITNDLENQKLNFQNRLKQKRLSRLNIKGEENQNINIKRNTVSDNNLINLKFNLEKKEEESCNIENKEDVVMDYENDDNNRINNEKIENNNDLNNIKNSYKDLRKSRKSNSCVLEFEETMNPLIESSITNETFNKINSIHEVNNKRLSIIKESKLDDENSNMITDLEPVRNKSSKNLTKNFNKLVYETYEIKEENDLENLDNSITKDDKSNRTKKSRNSKRSNNIKHSTKIKKLNKENEHINNQSDKEENEEDFIDIEEENEEEETDKDCKAPYIEKTADTFRVGNVKFSLDNSINKKRSSKIKLTLSDNKSIRSKSNFSTSELNEDNENQALSFNGLSNHSDNQENETTTNNTIKLSTIVRQKSKKKQGKKSKVSNLKEITKDFVKEYSSYFHSFIVKKFLKEILDKSHLNLIKHNECLKEGSNGMKEIENLLKSSDNDSQTTALTILLEENKDEMEESIKLINEKFKEDIEILINKFEKRCFDSKYLELIVEKWKYDFISALSEIINY